MVNIINKLVWACSVLIVLSNYFSPVFFFVVLLHQEMMVVVDKHFGVF